MTTSSTTLKRHNGRAADAIRPIEITPGVSPFAEGSALIKAGMTHVYCTATIDEAVPRWMIGKGAGWVTAEYSMLPRATKQRNDREAARGKQGGRTVEIQRLIGRSLRAAVDMQLLGERQIIIDCDVLQADGGTRCASITGGYVALALAIQSLLDNKKLTKNPLKTQIAAISAGVIKGTPAVDLDYSEDSSADVDFNVVMTGNHEFVELQGTAEGAAFPAATLTQIIGLAETGLDQLFAAQKTAIEQGRTKR